jgi:hypothetical protein
MPELDLGRRLWPRPHPASTEEVLPALALDGVWSPRRHSMAADTGPRSQASECSRGSVVGSLAACQLLPFVE